MELRETLRVQPHSVNRTAQAGITFANHSQEKKNKEFD
jgi:hypothetical protein